LHALLDVKLQDWTETAVKDGANELTCKQLLEVILKGKV